MRTRDGRRTASFTARGHFDRDGAFQLLLAGSSVSLLGSRVTAISYPMLVLYLTGSPVTAGWVAFAVATPSAVAYIPAGVLVDRSDPWRAMLLSQIGRGCAIGTVVVSLAAHRATVPLLVTAAVVEQTLGAFSVLAEPRCVGLLVSRDDTTPALARMEARSHVVTLLGRPLGGFLFGLQPILPFLSDALSFGVSASTLISIRSRRADVPATAANHGSASAGHDVWAGLRWLCRDGYVRLAVVLCSATTLTAQALIMVVLGMAHSGHASALVVGTVLAASGGGGTIGSLIASRLPAGGRYQWLKIQMCVWWATLTGLAVANDLSFGWITVAMLVLGFTGALGNIAVGSYLLQSVDHALLGRVTSIGRLMSFGACAIGPVLGGALYQRYGAEDAIATLSVGVTVLAAVSLLSPSMRAEKTAPEACASLSPAASGIGP